MSDVKFYEKISEEIGQTEDYLKLKEILKEKTKSIEGTIYVLQKPLYNIDGDLANETNNIDSGAFVILIPNTKIIFTSINNIETDEFEDYIGSFIDSVTTLIGVFQFKNKIGNSRKWSSLIDSGLAVKNINDHSINELSISDDKKYLLEILISLISGSINTPDKGGKADNILDAVKKRIIQFDGDQTRFIYDDIKKEQISIQGLAGTGKTELLFHRLVNLYTQTDKSIIFTCHSKVLANDIKKRLPEFLDQMKVSERSDLEDRVKVLSSWGSPYYQNLGLYSYICMHYGLNFTNYSDSGKEGFDGVCKQAVSQLKLIADFKPFIGYILIDEAQDFSDSFFELCNMVSSEQIIIASDIFQKIYDRKSEVIQNPDFTLNKVYRTDPKNFMFSQFLGFGLKEKPIINWLSDKAWAVSGYSINKSRKNHKEIYEFTRDPISRFNDFETTGLESTQLIYSDNNDDLMHKVKGIISDIRSNYPNVLPGDIGIAFISKGQRGYRLADMISSLILQEFDWESQKIYESRERSRIKDKVFISNQNNVKGLEFSFLIGIVLDKITDDIEIRNTLYMMMTRSFLTSYLVLDSINQDIATAYKPLLEEISSTNKACIEKPDTDDILKEEELEKLISGSLTFEQKIELALNNKKMANTKNMATVKNLIRVLKVDLSTSVGEIEEIIENNKDFLNE